MLFNGSGVAEEGGVDGHEAMADVALAAGHAVVRCAAHRENGGEDLTQHTVAVALMAAQLLGAAAQRHDAAAILSDDVCQNIGSVCGRMSDLIQCPAHGQRHFHFVVHLQLAPGDNRGGSVEEEVIRLGGERAGNGVRAQHCLTAVGGNHNGLAVGAAKAHETFLAGQAAIKG